MKKKEDSFPPFSDQEVYDKGGIVGGCGHGPGGFSNVRLSDGEFMVKGKKVAGFPDATEETKEWAKNGTLLPFLVEGQLRKNGAFFQGKDDLADKHDVVTDQRIVSTMFLPSAAIVAKEMIVSLEKGKLNSRGHGQKKVIFINFNKKVSI